MMLMLEERLAALTLVRRDLTSTDSIRTPDGLACRFDGTRNVAENGGT
jgi:hypothetical protein